MSGQRWTVLGLARSGAPWFARMARWSTGAAIPVDFVKCVSAPEVRARLAATAASALMVGADAPGLDRDLIGAATDAGLAVVVVADPGRDVAGLDTTATLPAEFDRDALLRVLRAHAAPTREPRATAPSTLGAVVAPATDHGRLGRLCAVTGPGGTGASTLARALAARLARRPGHHGMVLLADLALDADQAMFHHSPDILPALQELVEAHRDGRPSVEQVRALTFEIAEEGHDLLLGLRRHRDWTLVRRRTFAASLESLRRAYRTVVADVDADVEGETETGSWDVEDRNTLAREALLTADVVVVVGEPTTKGIHALSRSIRTLHEAGVGTRRLVPVLNRAPRGRRRRAEAVKALAHLSRPGSRSSAPKAESFDNPVVVPLRNDVEDAIRDGKPLPDELAQPLQRVVESRLDAIEPAQSTGPGPPPTRVASGTLGSLTEQAP